MAASNRSEEKLSFLRVFYIPLFLSPQMRMLVSLCRPLFGISVLQERETDVFYESPDPCCLFCSDAGSSAGLLLSSCSFSKDESQDEGRFDGRLLSEATGEEERRRAGGAEQLPGQVDSLPLPLPSIERQNDDDSEVWQAAGRGREETVLHSGGFSS